MEEWLGKPQVKIGGIRFFLTIAYRYLSFMTIQRPLPKIKTHALYKSSSNIHRWSLNSHIPYYHYFSLFLIVSHYVSLCLTISNHFSLFLIIHPYLSCTWSVLSLLLVFSLSSWWFQPIWKILVKLDHLPQFSGWKFQKYLSCHHLDNMAMPQIIQFYKVFHYTPSILGYP